MEFGAFDEGTPLADDQFSPAQHSRYARSFSDELRQTSSHGNERYHALHFEAIERSQAAEEEEEEEQSLFSGIRPGRRNPSVTTASLEQTIAEMKQKILRLEMQLGSGSSNEDRSRSIGNLAALTPVSDIKMYQSSMKVDLNQPEIIPQLCERSWSDFMNKHVGSTPEYAIELLTEEPEYHRTSSDTENTNTRHRNHPPPESRPKSEDLSSSSDETDFFVDRIRINSPWILNTLARIDRNIDTTGSIVMLHPFKFLFHFEDKIMESMRLLESQSDEPRDAPLPGDLVRSIRDLAGTGHEVSALPRGIDNRNLTLQHMKCLTQFIQLYIKPTLRRLENTSDCKVRFRDLWYIFRPGVNVFMPIRLRRGRLPTNTMVKDMAAIPEAFQGRYQLNWRVTGTGGGRPNASTVANPKTGFKSNPFKVNCYYIDFDGRYFVPTIHTFNILPFSGERDITSLDLFPCKYMKESQDAIKEDFDNGTMIFDRMENSSMHYYYAGPTLTTHPCGCPIQKEYLYQEYIESEVILDFKMAFTEVPEWRPDPTIWKDPPVARREVQERSPISYWKDVERTKLENTEYDVVYDDNLIDKDIARIFRSNEQIYKPIPSVEISNASRVPDKDAMLLPGRAFAFVLRTRTFAPLYASIMQPIKPQTDGLRNLQLRDDHFKETVQALVRTHFLQKNAQDASDLEYDVVRGKGKGLVILLHGAPGVGKTFTAESVAAANGRPLFQISCGDLGLTPGEVEKALRKIFRLAQLWNCVLLLDECDIFLTQRSKTDIKRNSLVSVFLRVLEFYSGVIFLTTNRVGVLDDAIKSRITWIAYYPPLDEQQTRKIWKVNLKLLEERNKRIQIDKKGILAFAKENFRSGAATWNGRQIQNAIKVATALAEWDAYSETTQRNIDTRVSREDSAMHGQPKLLPEHFKTITAGTQAFDEYLLMATGFNDAERAYNAMERADDYTVTTMNASPYAGANPSAFSGSYDRNQPRLSISSASSNPWPRNSSPFRGSASPKTSLYGRDSLSSQKSHRPSINERQHQSNYSISSSSLGPNSSTSSLHPHTSRSRRSSGQQTAIPSSESMDNQGLVSPLDIGGFRSGYVFGANGGHSQTTAAPSNSSRTKNNGGMMRNLSNSSNAQSRKGHDDEQIGSGFGFSEDDESGDVALNGAEEEEEDDDDDDDNDVW